MTGAALTFYARVWFSKRLMTASAANLTSFALRARTAVVSRSLLPGLVLTIVGISLPTTSG